MVAVVIKNLPANIGGTRDTRLNPRTFWETAVSK